MSVPADSIGQLAANVVLLFLAIASVALRFAARKKTEQPLEGDDWTIFITLILCIGIFTSFLYGVCAHLTGVPWSDLSVSDLVKYRKVEFSLLLISHFIYGLAKISVILFYKKIFTIDPAFKITANVTLGAISLYIIASFFIENP
ncbi:hypothetical protein F5Y10DRAFT_288556 [Nemania abortiva]|nr:hypothetical protein F5Y10DRAFT_288556 [Nemania abortiva]